MPRLQLERTTEPLWLRPAESPNLHNAERTRCFVDAYGDRPIRAIDGEVVRDYRRGGDMDGTVMALRRSSTTRCAPTPGGW